MFYSNITAFDYEKILQFLLLINEYRNNYRHYVLNCLSEVFGYQHLTFLSSDYNGNFSDPIGLNVASSLCKTYDVRYNKLDIFRMDTLPAKLQAKKSLSILDIMPFPDYERTEYYNEFLKKENLYYEIAVPLKIGDNIVGGIGIFKQKDEGNFTAKDCEIINAVSSHVASNFNNILEITRLKKENQALNYNCLRKYTPEAKNDKPLSDKEEAELYPFIYNLTKREIEIILLVEEGLNNNEIADKLYISFHTVKAHMERIFKKLDVNNRTSMLHKFREASTCGNENLKTKELL